MATTLRIGLGLVGLIILLTSTAASSVRLSYYAARQEPFYGNPTFDPCSLSAGAFRASGLAVLYHQSYIAKGEQFRPTYSPDVDLNLPINTQLNKLHYALSRDIAQAPSCLWGLKNGSMYLSSIHWKNSHGKEDFNNYIATIVQSVQGPSHADLYSSVLSSIIYVGNNHLVLIESRDQHPESPTYGVSCLGYASSGLTITSIGYPCNNIAQLIRTEQRNYIFARHD